MELMMSHPLIRFLRDELALPQASIALAVQHAEQTPSLLPMILWQYGLITLAQLEQIFDWLEQKNTPPAPTYQQHQSHQQRRADRTTYDRTPELRYSA